MLAEVERKLDIHLLELIVTVLALELLSRTERLIC